MRRGQVVRVDGNNQDVALKAMRKAATMDGLSTMRFRGRYGICLAVAAAWSNSALAQGMAIDAPTDVAGTRAQPGYDALGIRIGSFTAYPTLASTSTLNSNVFARATNRESDVSVTISPALTLRNSDPLRPITISADARIRRFARLTQQNDDQFDIMAEGRYEIGADSMLGARVSWSQASISRGSFENELETGSQLQRQQLTTDLTAQRRFNRLTARLGLSGSKFHFDDVDLGNGSKLDQSFRNGRQLGASLGLSYQLSARVAAQVQGRINQYDYDDPRPESYRDATSYNVTVGARYEVTRLLLLELGAGMRGHRFKNPLFEDISGLALNGQLRWYPSPLLSIQFDLAQTTSTSSSVLVGAVNATTAKLNADYELKRNLVVSAGVGVSQEDYGQLGGNSRQVSLNGRVRWTPNRWLRVTPSVNYETRQRGTAVASTYDAFRFALTVTLAR